MSHFTRLSFLYTFALYLGLSGCADVNQLDEVPHIDHKIIGGVIETGEPQAVVLRMSNNGLCTGTLIAPRVVLTAAHCIVSDQRGALVPVHVQDVSVVVNGSLLEQSRVVDAIFHPNYNGATLPELQKGNDVALVYLETAFRTTPINLDRMTSMQRLNQVGLIVGFGKTIGYDSSSAGQKNSTPIQVIQYQNNLFTLRSPDQTYRSACHGDSGGPLYFGTGAQKVVSGITSFGPDGSCTKDVFYVSVAAHLSWIMDNFNGPNTGIRSKNINPSTPQPTPPQSMCVQLDRCLSYCQGEDNCRMRCANQAGGQAVETYNQLVNCFYSNRCQDQSCVQSYCSYEYDACLTDTPLRRRPTQPTQPTQPSYPTQPSQNTQPNQGSSNYNTGLNCVEILDCFNPCQNGDQRCYQGCFSQGSPSGKETLLDLIDCTNDAYCSDSSCVQSICAPEIQLCQADR